MRVRGLHVSTPGDREIVLTRDFQAQPALVFEAFTRPGLIRRWLIGPPGYEMTVCEIDLTPGGAFRYAWRRTGSEEVLACAGHLLEVTPPERIVHTERFDTSGMVDAAPMGDEARVETTFVEIESTGHTTLTMRCRYASREIRDGMLASGKADGLEASYARLDDYLRRPTHADPTQP